MNCVCVYTATFNSVFRGMVQSITQKMNFMKVNGMQAKEVVGVECISRMVPSMRESGMMTNEMEME